MQAPSIPNYGFLTGIADGVKQGLNTYMTMKNINHQQQMEELMTGYQKDENGNLTPTPQKQLSIDAENTKNKGLISEAAGGAAANAASGFYKGQGYNVPDNLSFSEQKGIVEPLATAKTKGIVEAGLLNAKNDHSDDQFDKRQTNQQTQAAQRQWSQQFGVNSPVTMRLEGANRIQNLIKDAESGKITETKQFLNRANAEVSAMETGKNNFALGSQERTELESSAADMRAVLNKVFNEQKGSDLSSQLKELKSNMAGMSDSYMDQAERTANQMETGAPDAGANAIHQKHAAMKNQYQKVFGHWGSEYSGGANEPKGLIPNQGATQAPAAASGPAQDPQIADFAKTHGMDYATAAQLVAARQAKLNGGK